MARDDTRPTEPIFIVGSGRSGTTLLYETLATHPDVAWFSNWTNRFPRLPQLALLSRWSPELRSLGRAAPSPAIEGASIYRHCGLRELLYEKGRRLHAGDVPKAATDRLVETIRQHLRWHGRSRFLHKNTNNSMRISYLRSVFPDAKFVHIVRDARAVSLSLLNVAFWDDLNLWWTDTTPESWEAAGHDPLVLCGMHWDRQVNAVLDAAEDLSPQQFHQIRYEDLVADPEKHIQEILGFCELRESRQVRRALNRKPIRSLNDRWTDTVSAQSRERLWQVVEDTAVGLGYRK